jgi:hypothetical protein
MEAAAAHDQDRRFEPGNVVVKDGGITEGEVDIGVGDLDPRGSLDPVGGQAELVGKVVLPPTVLFRTRQPPSVGRP